MLWTTLLFEQLLHWSASFSKHLHWKQNIVFGFKKLWNPSQWQYKKLLALVMSRADINCHSTCMLKTSMLVNRCIINIALLNSNYKYINCSLSIYPFQIYTCRVSMWETSVGQLNPVSWTVYDGTKVCWNRMILVTIPPGIRFTWMTSALPSLIAIPVKPVAFTFPTLVVRTWTTSELSLSPGANTKLPLLLRKKQNTGEAEACMEYSYQSSKTK